jgi:hypothetical protein
MGSCTLETAKRPDWAEPLGDSLALQAGERQRCDRQNDRKAHRRTLLFVEGPAGTPLHLSFLSKKAPGLSPTEPSQRATLITPDTRTQAALDHRQGAIGFLPPAPLARGRSSSFRDQLERAQSRTMLIDVGDDNQFVGPGFRDQRLDAGADRLGRADD